MSGEDILSVAFKGNQDALALARHLFAVAHVWDDLIDRDKPVTDDAVNALLWSLLSDLPRNPFYYTHFAVLQPLIENAMLGYSAANALEHGDRNHRAIAYTLRVTGVINIFVHMAYLIGGRQWAEAIAPQVWAASMKDGIDEYFAELEGRDAAQATGA